MEGVALECLVFPSIVGETVQKHGAKRLGVDLTKTYARDEFERKATSDEVT